MSQHGKHPRPAYRTEYRRPARRAAGGPGEGGERMVEEELRQLGRELLDAPVPRHLREILTTARDRQG
jgi:hypothetical protein